MDVMSGVVLDDDTELKIVTGIDDHSRLSVAAGLVTRGATARAVCEVFSGAMNTYGMAARPPARRLRPGLSSLAAYPTGIVREL
jgi:hypothetical protein